MAVSVNLKNGDNLLAEKFDLKKSEKAMLSVGGLSTLHYENRVFSIRNKTSGADIFRVDVTDTKNIQLMMDETNFPVMNAPKKKKKRAAGDDKGPAKKRAKKTDGASPPVEKKQKKKKPVIVEDSVVILVNGEEVRKDEEKK